MPAYTLADVEQLVYDRLESNTEFYPQSEVHLAINEAQRVYNLFGGFIQTTANVTGGTQAGRVFYDVPQTVLFPLAVSLNNRQLKRASFAAIAMNRREWLRHTTANFGPTATWIPIGIRKFAIHPAELTAAKTLAVTGVQEPTVLALATDPIPIPEEFVEGMVEMAALTLQLKEGGKIFADASVLYQKFLRKAKEWQRWRIVKHPRYWVESESPKKG